MAAEFQSCIAPVPFILPKAPYAGLIVTLLMQAHADHVAVHAFYSAAIKAGGICNGKPGYRLEYFKYYYGAFILDPMGNNIEVMCPYPAWTQLWWWWSWVSGGNKALEPANKKE